MEASEILLQYEAGRRNFSGEDLEDIDLSGADLREINLKNANLHKANLGQANLSDATLKEATLIGADLSEANLYETKCQKADFTEANLSKANCTDAKFCQAKLIASELVGAKFYEANLREANLSHSNLIKANFSQADLKKALLIRSDFSQANLCNANLREATLDRAILRGADLSQAELNYANLSNVDLTRANLSKAKLNEATLIKANLFGANLSVAECRKAKFIEAEIREANLRQADFSEANLTQANLRLTLVLGTDFDRAELTGACLEDWHYNRETKLYNVACQYFYLKENSKERCPYTLTDYLDVGEFSQRFSEILEAIELIFKNGGRWHKQEIEKRNFMITSQQQIIEAQSQKIEHYEERINDLKYHTNNHQNNIISIEAKTMAENKSQGDTYSYSQSGSGNVQIGGGQIQSGAKIIGINNEAQPQNLAQAAQEIQQFLQQLDNSYSSETTNGKMKMAIEVVECIENNPNLKQRILSALKAGGIQAFERLLDHPAASFVAGALADWQASNNL